MPIPALYITDKVRIDERAIRDALGFDVTVTLRSTRDRTRLERAPSLMILETSAGPCLVNVNPQIPQVAQPELFWVIARQLSPELTGFRGWEGDADLPNPDMRLSVGTLRTPDGVSTIGSVVFNRHDAALYGLPANSDNWLWSGDPWPKQGFTLTLAGEPSKAPKGEYLTWADAPLQPGGSDPVPGSPLWLQVHKNGIAQQLWLRPTLDVANGASVWRQNWVARFSALQNGRLNLAKLATYAFVPSPAPWSAPAWLSQPRRARTVIA